MDDPRMDLSLRILDQNIQNNIHKRYFFGVQFVMFH